VGNVSRDRERTAMTGLRPLRTIVSLLLTVLAMLLPAYPTAAASTMPVESVYVSTCQEVEPSLSLSMSNASGLPGSQVQLVGSGFIPAGQIRILGVTGSPIPPIPVSVQGSFSTSFAIPSDAQPGQYSLTFVEDVGTNSNVCTYAPQPPFILTVTAPQPPTPTPIPQSGPVASCGVSVLPSIHSSLSPLAPNSEYSGKTGQAMLGSTFTRTLTTSRAKSGRMTGTYLVYHGFCRRTSRPEPII